jgi:UDP-N-acetylglucosamine pyrophosphorylase
MKKSIDLFVKRYQEILNVIPNETRNIVNRPGGLTEADLLDLILNPQDQSLDSPRPPANKQIISEYDSNFCKETGISEILSGKVAYCIMAGGAGTRIGEPKALLRLPKIGMSLLTIKLFQAIGNGPIWIVVSPAIKQQIIDHVASQIGIDHNRVRYIEQFESYRLYPHNEIIMVDGNPELYPCGHGDLFQALVNGHELEEFINKGGKYISVVNVDNVLASLDPTMIGLHQILNSNVTCEVVERKDKDSGGVVCVDRGQIQVAESYRIRGTDISEFKWLNTNSLIFNANLNIEPLGNSWNRVQKVVNEKLVIQHERLLQEITEAYDTKFVAVDRNERFFPIKNLEDLSLASEKLNANKLS